MRENDWELNEVDVHVTGALGGAARHAEAGKGRQSAESASARAQPGAHGELGHRFKLGENPVQSFYISSL